MQDFDKLGVFYLGKGYDLKIYDRNVNLASLVGANRDFILNRIPHISRLMVTGVDAVLDHAQTVVIGNKDPEFQQVSQRVYCFQEGRVSLEGPSGALTREQISQAYFGVAA